LVIDDVRIAYGGVGPVILRLPKTEQLLKGQIMTEQLMETAGELARDEITPISDVRSSRIIDGAAGREYSAEVLSRSCRNG